MNSAQVRKDLAYFGEFGIRGIGYDTTNLRVEIQRILGLDREWRVVLVGFGNLGSALFHYRGFARQGFRIAAIVDDDPAKVGRAVNGLSIQALAELPRVVKAEAIQIGVVAVPAEAAQGVADRLVAAGVRAILNFAPSRVKVPKDVRLQNVDLSIELENLPSIWGRPAVSGSAVATLAAASLPTLDAWGDLAQARAALAGAPGRIRLEGLWGSAASLALAALLPPTRPAIVAVADEPTALRALDDLRAFAGALGRKPPGEIVLLPVPHAALWRDTARARRTRDGPGASSVGSSEASPCG